VSSPATRPLERLKTVRRCLLRPWTDNEPAPPRRPLTEEEMLRVKQQDMLLNFDAETALITANRSMSDLMHTVKDNTLGVRYEDGEPIFVF